MPRKHHCALGTGVAIETRLSNSTISRYTYFKKKECVMFRTTTVGLLATLALFVLVCGPIVADSAIDANSFTYDSAQTQDANDFHLEIKGTFKDAPESDVFPNRTYSGGKADFSGSTVPPGGSHNVKFESTGDKPAPEGQFTKDGKNVGGKVKSKALDGTTVAYVPDGSGGYAVALNITNAYGAPLQGECAVYVNTGYGAHFDVDNFDTLWPGHWMVMPTTAYMFMPGQGFLGIMAHLNSEKEFLLIVGTADAGDGAGPFPFAIGLSPVEDDLPIGVARRQEDGTHVRVSAIVTYVGMDEAGEAFFYIEEEDRSSGICVYPPMTSAPPPVGSLAHVYGNLARRDGERVILATEPVETNELYTGLPDPFGMRARDVGGGDLGEYNPGVYAGRGALNVGLKVQVAGMVTAVDMMNPIPQWFCLWDGTNMVEPDGTCHPLDDGAGHIGVRVRPCPGPMSLWGDWYTVTGVVSTNAHTVLGRVIPEILLTGPPVVESFFDIMFSKVKPRPPLFIEDALLPGWNLFALPASPAGMGDGDPSSPKPWEAPVVFGRTPPEVDGRLYRWESANQSQYMWDIWSEPNGQFGGMALGDGYWMWLDGVWNFSYSAKKSWLDQWVAACQPGWVQMGHTCNEDIPLVQVSLHDGGQIKPIREASQWGDGWIQSIGFWWDNTTQSQYDIGLPEDWAFTDTLYPWHGYSYLMFEGTKSLIMPAPPELRFDQIDFNIQGISTPNSSWGACDLTYTGSEDMMYLNLDVNGNWRVQNVPVMSGDGVGKRQTVRFDFDLGVPSGTNVSNLQYRYSLTSGTLPGAPPGKPVWAGVGDVIVKMNSGIKGATMPQPGMAPLLIGTDSLWIAVARVLFPNQECPNVGECVPTAVSNSLKYLNTAFGLGMTDAQMSIDTMKTATGYDPSPPPGCYSNWPDTKNAYMGANGYPINTTTTNNWDDVVTAWEDGADVELRSPTHCAAVTAISKGADGKYTITVAHDTNPGNAGGTTTQTVVYDPATGTFTGGAGFDGQTPRPTCIETAKK